MKIAIQTLLALVLTGAGQAGAASSSDSAFSGTMKDMVVLPMQALVVARKNGHTVIVSDNGRFVVRGELYDTWSKRTLRDLDDAREAASRIDLDKMRLKIADLGPLVYGGGAERVTVLLDGDRTASRSLLDQIRALGNHYTFDLVLMPGGTTQSVEAARDYRCATVPRQAAERLVSSGDTTGLNIDPGCTPELAMRAMVAARLLGVRSLPFLIAPDGRVHQGAPGDLSRWLGDAS
ncbi:MAG: hypothetical protein U9R74_02345 [Pseudomonadota bacterium]|nr:hypothetical protein [Pseudomonadota bacterium]